MGDRTRVGRVAVGRRDADDEAWLTERFDGARVWTTRVCGHVGFASEAALKAAGITKETNIPGGVIELDAAGPDGRAEGARHRGDARVLTETNERGTR